MEDYFYEPETGAYSFAPIRDEAEEIDDRFFSDEDEGDSDEGDSDEGDDLDGETVGPDNFSDDGEALASIGWGTDEDYGCYDGGDEW